MSFETAIECPTCGAEAIMKVTNCSCHITAPCSACTDPEVVAVNVEARTRQEVAVALRKRAAEFHTGEGLGADIARGALEAAANALASGELT